MSVQAWFAPDEISVRPGSSASLALSVENIGDRTHTFTLIPAGLTASWVTVMRPNVTLFGGSRDVVEVLVRPPAIHSTSAGPASVSVRVVAQGSPDDTSTAETIVTIENFDDRRVTTLQPLRRARRRAVYEFMVENHGNSLANCRLHLIDASNRVDGSFDPPAVGVAPGSTNLVRLRLRAKQNFFRRHERQLDFEIEATEPDHEPALGRATMVQPPTIPTRAITRILAAGVALLAIVGAWRWVVKPELNDAADRAVAERLTGLDPAAPTTTVAIVTTTLAPANAEELLGEPEIYRLALDVGLDQTLSQPLSIPPDSSFQLTDIVLQNPNGDFGTARLLRNGDVLYEWDLSVMASPNEFQPRVTPIPFSPSDNLVLSVTCEGTGESSATGCAIAVLLGGRLVPIDSA